MQLLELALVGETISGDVDEVVVREVEVLQLRVKLHGAVDRFDLVVADDEPLYGGVEGDGQDVQPAFLADHNQRVVVTAAAGWAVGERRCSAAPRQQH